MDLETLFQELKKLSPEKLQGVTYNLTHRNSLDDDWWVFMPGTWNIENVPDKSPLEEAIVSGLQKQYKSDTIFIDIAHLGPYGMNNCFFENKPNILDQLRELIQKKEHVIIRYLEGNTAEQFAQNGNGNSNQIAGQFKKLADEHPAKVSLYFGSLAPDFELFGDAIENQVDAIWDDVFAYLSENHHPICVYVEENEKNLKELYSHLVKAIIEYPFSWNHAKIFAINGVWLMQGGGNYWVDYQQGCKSPFDLSMKINGDSAIDAHNFCNCLWGFMAKSRSSYTSCQEYNSQKRKFERTESPAYFDSSSQKSVSIGDGKVLTTNDLGLWPGAPSTYIHYDLITNIMWPIFHHNLLNKAFPRFCDWLYQHLDVGSSYSAGRYIRNYAIANARSNIFFSQQKFVMDDLYQVFGWWFNFVAEINKLLKFSVGWDGLMWDFELINALATATGNKNFANCGILTSYYIANNDHGGYQDPITADQFIKMVSLFAGMDVSNKITCKRISDSSSIGNHSKLIVIDTDVLGPCERRPLLYIGSQNAYVSYNQEFGTWIQDYESIRYFMLRYGIELWRRAPIEN